MRFAPCPALEARYLARHMPRRVPCVRAQVAGVIVGARNAKHVQQHQKLFSFSLDEEDRQRIDEVAAQGVQPSSDCYTWERGGSFA